MSMHETPMTMMVTMTTTATMMFDEEEQA